jgi:hypothetical protein
MFPDLYYSFMKTHLPKNIKTNRCNTLIIYIKSKKNPPPNFIGGGFLKISNKIIDNFRRITSLLPDYPVLEN